MKPIHLLIFITVLFASVLSAQVEIKSTKNTQAGQGNTDPRSEFENHAIVKYNNKYYDPSYGSPIANDANSWVTPALDGFGSIIKYTDIVKHEEYYINWIGYINDNYLQTIIQP